MRTSFVKILFCCALYISFTFLAMPAHAQGNASGAKSSHAEILWQKHGATPRKSNIQVATLANWPAQQKDLRLTIAKAEVKRIIDEQTLVLDNGKVIQLTGLYFIYNKNGRGPDALRAYDVLQQEFLDKFVKIYQTKDEKTGRVNGFGHELGHIVRDDGTWLQGSLIASGLARVYTTPTNPELHEDMLSLEREARLGDMGFWTHNGWSIKKADLPQDIKSDQFQIVEGHITSVSSRNNNIYLNFGSDWKTDFTLTISSSLRREFSKLGHSPMDWAHKHIRVRGWVERYNGPMMEIKHPSQIEFLDRTDRSMPVKHIDPNNF